MPDDDYLKFQLEWFEIMEGAKINKQKIIVGQSPETKKGLISRFRKVTKKVISDQRGYEVVNQGKDLGILEFVDVKGKKIPVLNKDAEERHELLRKARQIK